MYKKKIINSFEKDGFNLSLLNINYKDVSISFVSIRDKRKTYCQIKNSPIYYYIIEGEGKFLIDDSITVSKNDLIEIPNNKRYTFSGNMKMLEIIPSSFATLKIIEEKIERGNNYEENCTCFQQ